MAAANLATSGVASVSDRTVRRALTANGVRSYVKKKKPWLTTAQKAKRMKFCREVKNWTDDDWSKVLFSDESSFDVCGPAATRYTWKKPGDVDQPHNLRRTSKFGGGRVKVWACFGFLGEVADKKKFPLEYFFGKIFLKCIKLIALEDKTFLQKTKIFAYMCSFYL